MNNNPNHQRQACWLTQKVDWMGRFEQIPTHPPQNSRCSVANVDNQALNPLHEPLQTVAHSR
jgi:hypothetical protein